MDILSGLSDSGIVTSKYIMIKILNKEKKNYYFNVIKYLDEHLYFNYLKNSDPLYGLNFETQLPYYLKVDAGVSVAIILYQRAYPEEDDEDIYLPLVQLIQNELDDGNILTTEEIKNLRDNM